MDSRKGLWARPYQSESDLRAMQSLVQRVWSKQCHIHIGDLAWQRGRWKAGKPDWPTMLWRVEASVVAWGWMQLPNELEFLVDPAMPELVDVVLAWAEGEVLSDQLNITVLETETHLVEAFSRHGYQPVDGWFFDYLIRSLDDIPEPVLPPGFTARAIVLPDDFARRVQVHRRAWSILPFSDGERHVTSKLTPDAFQDTIATWPYRADLDWVVVSPDGEFVATCCTWLDETNGVIELEPVGTDPAYRRWGLGSAVCLAAMGAARAVGAREAIVYARGDEAYPLPRHLYAKLGFVRYGRTRTYARTITNTR